MNLWNLPVTRNPLKTKEDLRQAFLQLTDPLKPYYSESAALLHVGNSGAAYAEEVAAMEGFSRVLWGLVPFLAGGGSCELWNLVVKGIKNGTDPAHKDYWGTIKDYDQRSVEMAAFGLAFMLVPERLKESFNEEELERFRKWLDQITTKELWDCNWLFFLVMVQLGFKKAGLPYNAGRMEEMLERMERFYLEDGWYADGVGGHSDYYNPFAIQFYGLVYAAIMEQEDPNRSRLYKDRAEAFAKSFIHWFAEDGSALPYGRSLAYRFAQSAFWSAAVYAGIEPFPLGVMKGIILRNLRWWFQQPIFHPDGVLTVGYAYPNLVMAENYNSPGSPYWSFKTFLPLALPEDHPFWTAEEEPLPKLPAQSIQEPPHLVLCRQEDAPHVLAFNTGHPSSNEHTHTSAKYEKFVYSTFFGFSVPRAEWGLAQGAFDSMLALSEGDNLFRVRRKNELTSIREDGVLYSRWKPWENVQVETWLVPGTPWHVRVHRVQTERLLDAAEGGFALGLTGSLESQETGVAALASTVLGASGIRILFGGGSTELLYPQSNTNVLNPRTVLPTIRTRIEPGQTVWLATAVYGIRFGAEPYAHEWSTPPQAREVDGELILESAQGQSELLRLLMV